jgi:hypothetical protein
MYEAKHAAPSYKQAGGIWREYLASLDMEFVLPAVDETGAPASRSSTTSQPFPPDDESLLRGRLPPRDDGRQSFFTMQERLIDRFGDNGINSVIVCRELAAESGKSTPG